MLGNVLEWCADHWHETYDGAPADGSAWFDDEADDSAARVIRSGSCYVDARYSRAAFRQEVLPDLRSLGLGFRPARGQG